MEDHQRSALRRSHVTLVQNLEPRGPVLDTLFEDGVLTENDCERITHAPTQKERCQLLLHLIPTRGPGAYGSFRKALKCGEYGYLADKLKQELPDHQNGSDLSEQTNRKQEIIYQRNDTPTCATCKNDVKSILESCHDSELRKMIEESACQILDNVEPFDVIDQLFQDGIINTDEVDAVRSGITRRGRCVNFLKIIAKNQKSNTQQSLSIALTKKYKYIAQKLSDTQTEDQDTEQIREELTEAKVVDRPIRDNEYCDLYDENTQTEIFRNSAYCNEGHVAENESESETDLKVIDRAAGSIPYNKNMTGTGINTPDSGVLIPASVSSNNGVHPTQARDAKKHVAINRKKHNSYEKKKADNSSNVDVNKAKKRLDGNAQRDNNKLTEMVRYKEMAVMPSAQSHKRNRLTVAFNYLSTLINQGEFEKYEMISTNLQYRSPQNHDLMCIIGYLNASRDLFKTDFDSAKRNINATMQIVPKTSNPRYFILELFTAKTRMYITQKKLEKLQKTLDEAMMILETDPEGCTGRAAGWLYINDARNKTAQMSCLNLSKPNALKLYEDLFNRAKTSFQRAMNNFEMDGGKDGPFGFGYALCRLVILLLRCGDNGMTMSVDAVKPSEDEVESAGQYIHHLENSDIAIPKIMDMHFRLAKCDYQFRSGKLVRGLQHAQEAYELATELNMLEFTEHAHNRLKLLRGMEPMCSDKIDMTEEEIQKVLFGETSESNEISQSE